MQNDNLINFLVDLNNLATSKGASSADSIIVDDTAEQISVRNGKVDQAEYSRNQTCALRVFVGKKHAMVSTSDFDKTSMDTLVERAISMAKEAPEDNFSRIAESHEITKINHELELFDDTKISQEKMKELALRAENSAYEIEGVTNSDGANFSQNKSYFALATTNGFVKSSASSNFAISCSVVAGKDQAMETDYDFSSKRFFTDLSQPEKIGQTAGIRALTKLNPKKIQTFEGPVLFPNRFASSLISQFAGSINGATIARGTSFLKNEFNKQIFDSNINIYDDPLIKRGVVSRSFDAEGLECRKTTIVERGVLKSWLLDIRSANQLGLASTAHASRGISTNPYPTNSNFYLEPSKTTIDELVAGIKKGIIITGLFGGGVNILTGNFSQGASGLYVENGEIMFPVSEFTIASNLKDMFKSMQIANDLEMKYAINSPSVLIEKMTIAGT
ncbi:MAG: TldD/PmbA family protein [Sphingobacteriia bacterium]|nr:TldD/PmbA family protein [Sphingobacteriia bacterium]